MEQRLQHAEHAIAGVERLASGYLETLAEKVTRDNAIDAPSLEKHQFIAHGYIENRMIPGLRSSFIYTL